MTTIAFRDGVMAADSCISLQTEAGGARKFRCEKLYRKFVKNARGKTETVIIGLAGESAPGLVFLDWYGTDKDKPTDLIEGGADFTALILTKRGLFEADAYCRPEKILNRFYAVGSGAKAAMGAMHAGATAIGAVKIAARIDPYTAGPFVTMGL
jgi:hypothetical protein